MLGDEAARLKVFDTICTFMAIFYADYATFAGRDAAEVQEALNILFKMFDRVCS